MKKIVFAFAALLFALASVSPVYAALTTGEAAPDFSLPDTAGQNHSLAEHKGSYVVLEWINHDCPFVKKHYDSGNMQQLQTEYTAKGVVWYSVASSAPEKQGHYTAEQWNELSAEKKSAASGVLLDPDGAAGKLYGAQTTPHMFIIDPDGKLIYQGAIDSKASTNPADIEGSENYVKKALDEAMSGQPVSNASTKAYGCSVKY